MLTTLALLAALISQPVPSADPCSDLLADAPNLEGLAVELAAECNRDRAAVATQIEYAGLELARPDWALAEMAGAPEFELQTSQVSPFAPADDWDPFDDSGPKHAPDFAEPASFWWPAAGR